MVIFQDSIDSGTVPAYWKVANVTLPFKRDGTEKAGNYRPVSLTPVGEKILKSIIIVEHLESKNRIRQSQHGFAMGKLCLTDPLEFF